MSIVHLLLGLVILSGEDPAQADLQKLQGTWVLTSMERDGAAAPPEGLKGMTAVYEGNRVTLREGERVRRRGIITLDPTRTPRAINTWDQDGPYEDQTSPGIYELAGDTLRIAFAHPDQERPRQFSTKQGGAVLMCVYKKQAPR